MSGKGAKAPFNGWVAIWDWGRETSAIGSGGMSVSAAAGSAARGRPSADPGGDAANQQQITPAAQIEPDPAVGRFHEERAVGCRDDRVRFPLKAI
jgi:hypothetical protein